MANFVMSKARRLFSYTDLEGPNNNMAMETTSISIGDSPSPEHNASQPKQRRKCIIVSTCAFGLLIIVSLAIGTRHRSKITSALKNLPAAFSSASSSASEVTGASDLSRQVKLADISSGAFYPLGWNGTWISGFEFIYHASDRSLKLYNVKSGHEKEIMSANKVETFDPLGSPVLSADKKYILIRKTSSRVFRRSSIGTYVIISLNGEMTMVKLRPSDPSNPSNQEPFGIRYVSWAPKGNGLVYIDIDNNIWYRKSVLDQDAKVSDNGQQSVIYNGIPDWVFEEEVFEDNKALWWSPDATKLVWGSFDDSQVDVYLLQKYGTPWPGQPVQQYPDLMEVRYPKVGNDNPVNNLWLTDLTNITTSQILPPPSLHGEVHFSHVTWANPGQKFAVTWFNRVQNESVLTLCDVSDLDCSSHEIFKREEQHGWVPYKYKVIFNPNPPNPMTSDFVAILPAPHLIHHYRQLAYISGDDRPVWLTQVDGAEVTDILKWTSDGFIYYMSTLPNLPGTRHLFRIQFRTPQNSIGSGKKQQPECVSCNRTMENLGRKEMCQYYDVDMSLDGTFMTMICKGPDVPYACIHPHTPSDPKSQNIKTFETNPRIESLLETLDMPTLQFLEVPVSGTNQKAQVKLMFPPNFDPGSGKKYPLVVYAYGGPGYQSVNAKFDFSEIGTYLAGSQDVIYATVDPRGSGYQGEDWRFAVYKKFGTAEVQSLTEVTKHLQENLTYIDKEKTGVWGWSYGGYLSLMTLTHDFENVFTCGASVAPVVDWTLYDTYYTERYMGLNTEEDNFDGYQRASALTNVSMLRNKRYFLLHGTHDDNVHYQNSMLLSATLERQDILFRQQAYPDQDHSIGHYIKHLHHSLVNFFLSECFGRPRLV